MCPYGIYRRDNVFVLVLWKDGKASSRFVSWYAMQQLLFLYLLIYLSICLFIFIFSVVLSAIHLMKLAEQRYQHNFIRSLTTLIRQLS